MIWLLTIFSSLVSFVIIYQDFNKRRINLLLTLFFILLIFITYYLQYQAIQLLFNCVFSLIYLLLCYFIIRLYFNLKGKRGIPIVDQMVGWGDIILLIAIGSTLEPDHMIYFFAASFISALIFHLIISSKNKSIPLAAYLLIIYNCYIIYNLFHFTVYE